MAAVARFVNAHQFGCREVDHNPFGASNYCGHCGHRAPTSYSGVLVAMRDSGCNTVLAMDSGPLAAWAAAGISVVSAAGSLIGWWRARAAKAEATEQARLATQAHVSTAADVKRIADAGAAQKQAQAERLAAEEVEPWAIDPIEGYTTACNLRNKTGIAKYGITITGQFVTQPSSFDFIGPYGHKRFGVVTGIGWLASIEIAWHQSEDLSDTLPPQTIVIP
jgi:hypothetical protein